MVPGCERVKGYSWAKESFIPTGGKRTYIIAFVRFIIEDEADIARKARGG